VVWWTSSAVAIAGRSSQGRPRPGWPEQDAGVGEGADRGGSWPIRVWSRARSGSDKTTT
jgi:hypothetical protein